MSKATDHELDLPLLSNNNKIDVYHYILDLRCQFEKKQFEGTMTIFCKPVKSTDNDNCEIDIKQSQSRLAPLDCEFGGSSSSVAPCLPLEEEIASVSTFAKKAEHEAGPSINPVNDTQRKVSGNKLLIACEDTNASLLRLPQSNEEATNGKDEHINDDLKLQNSKECCNSSGKVVVLQTKRHLENTNSREVPHSSGIHMIKLDKTDKSAETYGDSVLNAMVTNDMVDTKTTSELFSGHQTIDYIDTALLNEFKSEISNTQDSINERASSVCEDIQILYKKEENIPNNVCLTVSNAKQESDEMYISSKSEVSRNEYHINPHLSNDLSSSKESINVHELCEVSETDQLKEDFEMVLDSWDIFVESVEEIIVTDNFEGTNESDLTSDETYRKFLLCLKCEGNKLEYQTDKRCIKIRKKGVKSAKDFPRVLKITYRTHPKGYSLKWTKDQDGRECVFTHGHWINNRSLFPSQDVPEAMATWQSIVHTPRGSTVLMSGDCVPSVAFCDHDWVSYSFYTKLEMPSSTLALAVGFWKQADIIVDSNTLTSTEDKVPLSSDSLLPCRLFSPNSHLEEAKNLIGGYIPRCMKAANQMLGPHPFKRLDILLVPSSFCSLGMASPSLMFISQSILSSDREMLIRLAHEMSHSWFGLIIGPRDWTEEWLSEGFCTYTECYLHSTVMQRKYVLTFHVNRLFSRRFTRNWSEKERQEQMEIQDYLKYKTLESELVSSQSDLQTLRPNKGDRDYVDGEMKYVRNGMNPDKGFMQVHYLKGYFLLQYLENCVGRENFYQFLRSYIHKFSGSLILSQDFISLYFTTFPVLRDQGITEAHIYKDWLDNPGLPVVKSLSTCRNTLAKAAKDQAEKISTFSRNYQSLHWSKKRKLDVSSSLNLNQLKSVQVLLLLDYLVHQDRIHPDVLKFIRQWYKLNAQNADIQHKWCELIVKNKLQQHYEDVENFLRNHQAMGVYLFGELILSLDRVQRRLAEESFRAIADDMEDGVYKTVHLMVYGT